MKRKNTAQRANMEFSFKTGDNAIETFLSLKNLYDDDECLSCTREVIGRFGRVFQSMSLQIRDILLIDNR